LPAGAPAPPNPPADTAPILPPPPTPISISITGPSSVTQGCSFTLTAHPSGFSPASIDWSNGTTYDGQLSATYVTTNAAPGTYTFTVTATTSDGRSASAGKSVTVNANVDQSPPVC
jgi:hypothetical protein